MEKKRLLSLDVLRGLTVFGMIVVNNAGGSQSYESLRHSAWNGLTPCDLVFPFFLFIMGISTYIALRKFDFQPSAPVIRKILKRTVLILLIGWAIGWFDFACEGDFFPFAHLRLTGVL
ncbi:heparan-alpha-glucosaminide N-acetyltransferase domain-containing protein, partial [Bacteroides sp. CAG:633]